MYFWNIENLKKDIAKGQFSEKDRFIYALIYVVLGAILMEGMILMPPEDTNLWDLVNSVGNVLIIFLGTIFAFQANGSSNGTDFLGKYFSIGFVMAIRFLVYAIPLLIFLFVYYFYAYGDKDKIPTNYIDVLPFLFWYGAMYWRMYVHIKQVNS